MAIEFDPAKGSRNLRERGLSFASVAELDWSTARVAPSRQTQHGEARFVAIGRIEGVVCVTIFTVRGENLRVISLRRAKRREVRDYEQA